MQIIQTNHGNYFQVYKAKWQQNYVNFIKELYQHALQETETSHTTTLHDQCMCAAKWQNNNI